MKKGIFGLIVTAGLLLLVSCEPKNGPDAGSMSEHRTTPTPIVVPTCTPTASPTPDPATAPTVTPTIAPTEEPMPSVTAEPTEMPEITVVPTLEPTVTPTPSPSPKATNTPTPSLTPSPEPTATPTPSPSPMPMPTATPTPTPTPAVDPETLVTNGWQKSISIDEKYAIIFPEKFTESTVTRTENELQISYTCASEENIEFVVCYKMQQTVREVALDILAANGMIVDEVPEEKRVYYLWKLGDTMQCGVLIELPYPQSLLGTSFGEEEWITGVMQVVFSYPADSFEQYETEEYQYYVIKNGEE